MTSTTPDNRSQWRQFLGNLFKPSTAVTDTGERRQAQVLSALSLVLALAVLLSVVATPSEVQTPFALGLQLINTSLFLAVYAFSRTRYFKVGSWLIVILLLISPFLLVTAGSENAKSLLLTFGSLTFVLSAILLSPWGLGFVIAATTLASFALPTFAPHIGYVDAVNAGGVLMTLGVLLIVANAVQRSVERTRLAELRDANQELEALRNSLETRVATRTQELTAAQARTEMLLSELNEASHIARLANYELDIPAQTLIFNDRFYELLGTSVGKEGNYRLPVAQAVQRFVHPEDAARLLADIQSAGSGLMSGEQTYRLLNANGRILTFSFRFVVETDEAGEPRFIKGAVQDVTERHEAEVALRQTENIYRRAIASADAVAYSRRYEDETFTFMGEEIYDITGYSAEEMTPTLFDSLVTDTVVHTTELPHSEAVAEVRAGTLPNWKADYLLRTCDGRLRWVADNSVEIIGPAGKPVGSVGIMLDITERKEAESNLAKHATQLETVTQLATAVATINEPQTMLQTIVDLTKEKFTLYHAHIYLLDNEEKTLILTVGAGEAGRTMTSQQHGIPLAQEQSLVARAARGRAAITANDVTQSPDFLPHPLLPDTRSELAVPLMAGAKSILGVLDVQSDMENYFSEEDVRLYTILAAQIAVALQNARATEQTNQTLQELDILTRRLTQEGWQSYFQQKHADHIGFVWAENEVIEQDAYADHQPIAYPAITKSVVVHGETIGQLTVSDLDEEADEVTAILEAVSQGLSGHIENLRLNEQTEHALAETRQRTEELVLINRVVSAVSATFDIQESMQIIVNALVESTTADQARIALLNSERNQLVIIAESFDATKTTSALGLEIPIAGNPLTEKVLATRHSHVVDDPLHDALTAPIHYLLSEQGIKQLVIIPMVVGNEVIGTLGIDILTEDVRFTSEELRLAETLVFQAATAVQNARLFEQVQSRARQERILREVSDRVYAAPDAETVLKTAAQEINRLLGLETVAYVGERPIFNESNGKSQSVNGH